MPALSIDTARLNIRWLAPEDAPFILTLVNDPDWRRFIGDRGVANLDDARRYIESGPASMYREHGVGLNRVALKHHDRPVGICGLMRREALDDPDLGFAFLPEARNRGYALEAAQAVLRHGLETLQISRVTAILSPDNVASAKLLQKLGFAFERKLQKHPREPMLDLYSIDQS